MQTEKMPDIMKLSRLIWYAFFLVLSLSSAGAVDSQPIIHGTLENGLEYCIEERPMTETVMLGIYVRGGLQAEKEELVGLTSLLPSLLLKGTETRKGDAIAKILENRGVRYSAYSDYFATGIWAYMPAGEFSNTIGILADMTIHPAFLEKELEKEKDMRLRNFDSYKDYPSSVFQREIYSALFPHHPLGYFPPFTRESLNAMSRDDLVSFHKSYFVPNNILIVIVGNIAADRALEEIERYFGSLPVTEIPEKKFSKEESLAPAGIRKSVNRRTSEARVWVGFRAEGIPDENIPSLIVLNTILGKFQMRLYQEIREKRGYAYWVDIDALNYPDVAMWGVEAGIQKRYLKEVESIIIKELMRIAEEPVLDEEMEMAKKYIKTNISRSAEVNSGRASSYSAFLLKGRPLRTEEQNLQRIDIVTREDVLKLSQTLFKSRDFCIFTLY